MNITVALCTDAPDFAQNRVLDRRVAACYPGALWMPELADRFATLRMQTVTGDVALERIASGLLDAKNVWVIQEDQSNIAATLIQMGAQAKVLLCAESPLFAGDFYCQLPELSHTFDNCILFRGALSGVTPRVGTHTFWFPSFDASQLTVPMAWSERKYLVMVAGNKYWRIRRSFGRAIAAKVRDIVCRKQQRFSKKYAHMQLHDQRLATLAYFGERKQLDLFGAHWNDLRNLPHRWEKELEPILKMIIPKICHNKLEVIAGYKFVVCFENMEFPGYVTEKIIDCLVAGAIPIYCGAPDIAEFVPEDCYINARKFSSLEQLSMHIGAVTADQGQAMIERGQLFLRTEGARMFSYAAFAERVFQMLVNIR